MVYRYLDSEFTTYNGFHRLFRLYDRLVGNSSFKTQRNKLQKCTSFICCIKIWMILQQIEVMCVQLRCRQGKAVLFYGIAHTIDTFEL